ncbi:SIP domain-containing protein [Mesorhizobium sp. M1329]|uniref:SIP domain-containing protein n=1 Tax=Mesorhizobium sp. M1329 TaxID=2957083 RepID=UPI0033351970
MPLRKERAGRVRAVGVAFVEIADEGERQAIDNATGIELHWLPRNGVQAGVDDRLAHAIRSVAWPTGLAFGWFAAEAAAARTVREHWRGTLALGRNETLAAAYWRRGGTDGRLELAHHRLRMFAQTDGDPVARDNA